MNRSASRLSLCGAIFDAANKKIDLSKSEDLILAPDFWNDSERSQKLMQDRKRLEKAIGEDAEVSRMTEEIDTFFELGREGETVQAEIAAGLKKLSARLEVLETAMLLSGENDSKPAILTIHPGAGGTESQDWAEMLLRMFLRWCERNNFQAFAVLHQLLATLGIVPKVRRQDQVLGFGEIYFLVSGVKDSSAQR